MKKLFIVTIVLSFVFFATKDVPIMINNYVVNPIDVIIWGITDLL